VYQDVRGLRGELLQDDGQSFSAMLAAANAVDPFIQCFVPVQRCFALLCCGVDGGFPQGFP